MFIIKEGKTDKVKNVVLPILATICCLFMIFAAIYSHGIIPLKESLKNGEFNCPVLGYLVLFAIVMVIGLLLNKKRNIKTENTVNEANNEN